MPLFRKIVFISLLIPFLNQAQVNIDSLRQQIKNFKSDTSACLYLQQLIEEEGDESVWLVYNEELKRICENNLKKLKAGHSQSSFYIKHLAEAFNNEAVVDQQRGDNEKALDLLNKSLNLRKQVNYKAGIAESLNNIGVIFQLRGDFPKTLEYYHRSLKIYEEINDKEGIALCLNNIGSIYKNLNNHQKAMEYFRKSLKLHGELNDKTGQSYAITNIGNIYSHQGDYKNALSFHVKGLKLSEEINDRYKITQSLNHIGSVYQNLANKPNAPDSLLEKALYYHNRSFELQKANGDKKGMAVSLSSIASINFQKGDTRAATRDAEKSLALSNELGYPLLISTASSLLSKLKAKTGDYKSAYELHVLFKRMTDSLNNEAYRKSGIQKELQYQYEKKATTDSIRSAEEKRVSAAKLKESEARLKQERTQRFALYGGIALVLIFAGFLYNRFKVTEKQKHIIEQKEQQTQKQNEIITHQKVLVEEKQKEIVDSINYAKRIQYSLLANENFLKENLHEHFVFFQPKDIVSGDFYWASLHKPSNEEEQTALENKDHLFYLAVCDSTGHGVPGAFMSLLNIGYLSEAIKEKGITAPHEVFNYVRERLINSISKEGQKDGFDGILVCLDPSSNIVRYAAANNAPVLLRNGRFIDLSNNRMPVGIGENTNSFDFFEFEKQSGDMLYLYTDGFADQFGGPKGKKYKYRQLNDLLQQIHDKTLPDQKYILQTEFNNWRGELEQVDDVCVVGIKFH